MQACEVGGGTLRMPLPERLVEALGRARKILVIGHVRPDGDAVASTLALSGALREAGKQAVACLVDGVPERFAFLPGAERMVRDPETEAPYDLVVGLDIASYPRMGFPIRERPLAPLVANIDHHGTNDLFADVNWVDTDSPATCQLVFELLRRLGHPLSKPVATCLMAGIATDTGFFKYPATTPRTLEVAAALLSAGVDLPALHRRLFEETTLGSQRLVGRALSRLVCEAGGRLVWTRLSHADGVELGVSGPLASLGVGPLTVIREAELIACFEERAEGDLVVELRSRSERAVDGLARRLGGGGHARASGATLAGPAPEAIERVLVALRALLA